ncbi:uncharacterized protein Fot_35131 [Forsythia ovata]|uniref:DUF7792 domain-containing protein n=1 Tax=Forsythia ovata TaxID=205694 RepID=A0ABD1SLR0_9LAMI
MDFWTTRGNEKAAPVTPVTTTPQLQSSKNLVDEAVKEAESFKFKCLEVGKKVGNLCQMLHAAVRLSTSTSAGISFYDCPLRRIATEVSKNLQKSLALLKKCKRRSITCGALKIPLPILFYHCYSILRQKENNINQKTNTAFPSPKWLLITRIPKSVGPRTDREIMG